ncbi:MAG: hypothetical protein ACFFCS_27995 [Candidatus Hodarchaeota archaeon]
MVQRKQLIASTAYVSLILGYLSVFETGILNPLNKFVFLEYTLNQWIFMILVVLGLGYVIGEILVSGNIKDTLKSTAKFFSEISDMGEGESEQFIKDVLGQTKAKVKEDVFGDKDIPGLAQLTQAQEVLGKKVNLTRKDLQDKLKSFKIDSGKLKKFLPKIKEYWKKFLKFTKLDKLTLIGKLALIFAIVPLMLIAVDLILRIQLKIIVEYGIFNLWVLIFLVLPISVYLLVAKFKKNTHIALYASLIFIVAIAMLNLIIVYNENIKESPFFGFLPEINETYMLSCLVAGIAGILIINAFKYKIFPKLKIYQLFGKEEKNEIVTFKKMNGDYVPTLIKAIIYPNRIEMLKGGEVKTIYSKLNLSEFLYGDVLLVAIDETFEDIIPVPIPQLSADFNFSPELAELVNTTSSFINSNISRSKEILNKIKDISNSSDEDLRDFIKNDFTKFKKRFLDLDIPIESFQKIVKVNLARKYQRPVTKKVMVRAQRQAAVSAMVDTGAEISLISDKLANRIGASPVSKVSISGIEDGMLNAPLVHVTIIIDGKEVPIEAAIFPIDRQIGKDLLLDQSVYNWASEKKIAFI